MSSFLKRVFSKRKHASQSKEQYIFYRLVDYVELKGDYVIQCVNTKATFIATLTEIVCDPDILYGLHPIQVCYLGIEYSALIENKNILSLMHKNDVARKAKQYQYPRYGQYAIKFQIRRGDICFVDLYTDKEYVMDPRDIALTKIIGEFDAIHAFYIGLCAGVKINNPITRKQHLSNKPCLTLVK